ncbi:MAG: acetylornithine/succinylornithine family transaminase [Clostridia bacterium]|nr:acetylornithine/succinylornithine family transaminase [Clostridia bacterium]
MQNTTKHNDQTYVAGTYGRFDVALDKASGASYQDEDGKAYIDLGSGIGVTLFGACDPDWVAAVTTQMNTLGHTSNLYFTAPQAKLAQLLCARTGMKKVFFGNSGAEANECALKVARKFGEKNGRSTIVTLWNSFHGRTIATLAATGQDKFHEHFGPFPEGFCHIHANNEAELVEALTSGKVCAILMEMVQGEGGVIPLNKEYVQLAEKLCRENDVLLMVDEVQTGNGRTGSLYAFQQYGITPDVVTTSKGLGGGLPIGACMLGEKCQDVLGKGDHGSTFGGNPICAAAALNVISRLNDDVFAGVREREAFIRKELEGAPGVAGVTGMGLMIGILPERKTSAQVAADCLTDGLMVLTAHEKVRLLPPLNISYEELKAGLNILKKNL